MKFFVTLVNGIEAITEDYPDMKCEKDFADYLLEKINPFFIRMNVRWIRSDSIVEFRRYE